MNKYLSIFLKNSILGGIFIGIVMLALEVEHVKLSGIISGSIPIGFLYVLIYYYFKNISRNDKISKMLEFSHYNMIGGLMFIIIVESYFLTLKYTNNFAFSWFIVFLAIIICIFVTKYL